MQSFARPLSIMATTVLLAACDGLPVQPALANDTNAQAAASLSSSNASQRDLSEDLYDLSDVYVQWTCEDGTESELIAMEGQIYERVSVLWDGASGFHAVQHVMPIGLKGVGTESGEEFRVKEQNQGAWNQSLMGATGFFRQTYRFVGVESKVEFSLTTVSHIAMNANGEYVVDRYTETGKCGE